MCISCVFPFFHTFLWNYEELLFEYFFAYDSRLVDKQLGAVDELECAMDSTYTNIKQTTIVEDQNLQERQSGDYVSEKLEVCTL